MQMHATQTHATSQQKHRHIIHVTIRRKGISLHRHCTTNKVLSSSQQILQRHIINRKIAHHNINETTNTSQVNLKLIKLLLENQS